VNSSRNAYTQHYIVTDEGSEIGFLSLDLAPPDEPLVIYEIFVPNGRRGNGLGTHMLRAAEEVAYSLGYKWTLVIPKTMDDAFPQTDLEAWYRRNDYEAWEDHAFGGVRKAIGRDAPE
jgi:GNAT superfamily N-acetyltransferase